MIRMQETDDTVTPKPLSSSIFSRRSSCGSQRHICARCGKPRSSRYHESHPLVPGQVPESDICTRPDCARFKCALVEGHCSQALVFEVHHYYHRSPDTKPPTHASELPGESSLAGRAEAISDLQRDNLQRTFSSELHYPMNHHEYKIRAAGSQGGGSLAGRGQLQYSAIRPKYRSGRLSPVREESPLSVNYLTKPTLHFPGDR